MLRFSQKNERLLRARRQLEEFNERFPFRERPQLIRDLTPSDVYEVGSMNYFFYWVEYGTRNVAHLALHSAAAYENAKRDLPTFQSLLTTVVDDSLSLHEKVDAPRKALPGFGGDRHVAKKVIALLYPERVFPILSTEHLEHFASRLGVDPYGLAEGKKFRKDNEESTVGEKFEALNDAILKWREENAPEIDNLTLAVFLYEAFPPRRPAASRRAGRSAKRAQDR